MSVLAGKEGSIYMSTTDASAAFTTEAMTDSGDHTTYYITDDDKRYWDKATTPTVYVDGSPETAVTIQYAGGRVVFDTPLAGTEAVTVTGKYFTVSEVGGFYNWTGDFSTEMADKTTFASDGWKESEPILNEFSVSAESYWQNGSFIDRLGTEIILALYVDETSDYRYEGYAYLSSDSISSAVNELITEPIEFTGNGNLYYNEA